MNDKLRQALIGWVAIMGIFPILFASQGFGKDSDYPARPINFMIPFGPGGTTDLTYRAFIDAAGKQLGQPFVPVNKAGAGGTIAAMAVQTAKADGYTLGGATSSNALVAPFFPDAPYRDLAGFTLIMNLGKYVYPLIVRGDAPWKTWKEFVDWGRANPRGAKIGLPGARNVVAQGFVLSQVEEKEKLKFTYVTFKSSAEILTAILGGHITMYGSTLDATVVTYLKEGKLRLLAFADVKAPGFEGIPSLKDIYTIETTPNLKAVWGPKGLPEPIVNKLEEGLAKAVKDQDFIKVMHRFFMPVVYMNRAELNKYSEKTLQEVGETLRRMQREDAREKKAD
jgi:tripartite-type tricarboxylate transporter receptor subunit TctC